MTCRLFDHLDPATGRPVRGIACSRGAPPPCPFPADPGADPAPGPDDATPHAFRPGAPFPSPRYGTGTVLGPAPADRGRLLVRFPGGRVVEYDLATLLADPRRDPLPFG